MTARRFKILNLLLILICFNQLFCQNEIGNPQKKVSELFIGGSAREGFHLGFLYGGKTSLGGYIGGFSIWDYNPSYGINLKHYFREKAYGYNYKFGEWRATRKNRNLYSPYFIRIGFGFGIPLITWDYGAFKKYTFEASYLACTFGGDIHFFKKFGLSLEIGALWDIHNVVLGDNEWFDLNAPILPAVGIKLFYHFYK